jgi:hypothetical protein
MFNLISFCVIAGSPPLLASLTVGPSKCLVQASVSPRALFLLINYYNSAYNGRIKVHISLFKSPN